MIMKEEARAHGGCRASEKKLSKLLNYIIRYIVT
jgi:hypothetical protein